VFDGVSTTEIVRPATSPVIITGPAQSNRIGVVAQGGEYLLYANGYFLTKTYDYTFTNLGKIGYFVRAATDQPFTVLFDDLKVWLLEDTFYPPQVTPPTYPLVTVPPPATNAPTVTATAVEPINVRSGPSSQYTSYSVAPMGSVGEVIGVSEGGTWWVVKIPTDVAQDGMGWVSGAYVVVVNGENVPVIPIPTIP
jgi:Bacterial SH3 domain